jgi:cellulose synthase/poly-beta-1,6-N-acetylglucosamine synthase-like glycosyltransferase
MFRENFVCFSSSMVRRAVLKEVGLFGEEYLISSDYDLWLRIATRYRFDYVDEPLVDYRRGHASLSKRPEKVLHEALTIMNRFSQGDEGRRLLKRSTLRRSYAETYCHMAYFQRDHSRTQSAVNYLRAALINPISWNPWRGMMILTMPEALRRRLRNLRSDDLLR